MKLDEIRKELQQLNTTVEDLSKRLSELYGEELPQEPAELSKGLRFSIASASFSEEEQKANEELQDIIVSSMRLDRTLSEELSAITRAQQSREQYTEVIESGADLVTLYKETEETLQQAQTISETLGTLSRGIQNIACSRYFNSLTHKGKSRKSDRHRAILAEIDAIGNGTDTQTADGEKVRTGGFAVIDSRGDSITNQLTQLLDSIQAVNLLCYYNNGFYELHYSTILPTRYKSITADKQRAFIRETIEPCFKSHLEAIRALHFPTVEADKLITKAVEDIYSQLNIVLDTGSADEAEGKPINAIKPLDYAYLPHTPITNIVFSGEPLHNERGKEIDVYNTGKEIIRSVLSLSLNDIEGIDWHGKALTLEEQGILAGIFTQQLAGNNEMSNRMVKKARSGGDDVNITANEEKLYREAWSIFGNIDVTIDQREYMGRKGKDGTVIDSPYRTGKLLSFDIKHDAPLSGQNVKTVYEVLRYSPVLQHMLFTGQYTRLPIGSYFVKGLQAKDYWIKDYIIIEIHRIKGDILNTETAKERADRVAREKKKAEADGKPYKPKEIKQHPIMLFESIYKKAPRGYPKRARDKADIQKSVQLILQDFKAKGLIKGYKLQYEGINRSRTKKVDKREKSTLATAVKLDVRNSEARIEEL